MHQNQFLIAIDLEAYSQIRVKNSSRRLHGKPFPKFCYPIRDPHYRKVKDSKKSPLFSFGPRANTYRMS